MTNVDTNQAAIAKFLRGNGAKVDSTTKMGGGFPDLLVTYRGLVATVEVKHPGHKLRPDQETWHNARPGMNFVIHDVKEAALVLFMIDGLMAYLRDGMLSRDDDLPMPALAQILLQSEAAYEHKPRKARRQDESQKDM